MARKKTPAMDAESLCPWATKAAAAILKVSILVRKENPQVVHLMLHAKKPRIRKKNKARLARIAWEYLKGAIK